MKNTLVLSSTTSKKLSSTLLVALLFYNTGSIFAKEFTLQEISVPTSSTQNLERNPFEAPKNSSFYNQNDVTLIFCVARKLESFVHSEQRNFATSLPSQGEVWRGCQYFVKFC